MSRTKEYKPLEVEPVKITIEDSKNDVLAVGGFVKLPNIIFQVKKIRGKDLILKPYQIEKEFDLKNSKIKIGEIVEICGQNFKIKQVGNKQVVLRLKE